MEENAETGGVVVTKCMHFKLLPFPSLSQITQQAVQPWVLWEEGDVGERQSAGEWQGTSPRVQVTKAGA